MDVCLSDKHGERVTVTAAPPDGDGLRGLADRLAGCGEPIHAALESTGKRLGRQRGAKVARVEVARKLAEAVSHMLTRQQTSAPRGPPAPLVA